jgi:mRNA-degrading endonuclease RelE of RelBE toxin-antitoxin system
MVTIAYDPSFEKKVRKIKDHLLKLKVKKQILKIMDSPEIGEHKRYGRKGTREVHVPPFRLSYLHLKNEDKIVLLGLYHKNKQ